jgi:PAS domain S-box-containing protein
MTWVLKGQSWRTFLSNVDETVATAREWHRMGKRLFLRFLSRDLPTILRSICQAFGRQMPNRRSLSAKIAVAGLVFIIVPLIIYERLGEAEKDKAELLFQSAREQGRLIALNLTPLLRSGPKSLPQIDEALATLASDNLNIRVLYSPKSPTAGHGFYYIASNPALTESYLSSEIDVLGKIGVLSRLSRSCSERETVGMRHNVPDGPQQLITVIVPVATDNGCWSIVTSYAGEAFLQSSFGRPYWQSPEMQFASLLYFAAAGITLLLLIRIRTGLRGFRDTAVAAGRNAGTASFFSGNVNPDLADVAHEFDRMVQRIGLLSFAVERSPIAVSVADTNRVLEYVNPAYEKLADRPRAELLGLDLRTKEFVGVTDLSWAAICDKVSCGDTWHGLLRRQKPDGRLLWMEVSLYRLITEPSGAEHFVCLQEDVTERQRILNGLVEEKERALALNRMKSNFVAQMSHEFRTPLNAILGFSEVIATETFGPCGEAKYVEYAGHVHSSGRHLLSLINDILDLSKLESGKEALHIEPVDLSRLVNEMVALVTQQGTSAGVALETEDELAGRCVMADERATKQVLLNLLSNGIKFTPAGGTVSVYVAALFGNKVRLTVSDTGCGIAEDEIPKICEPYERADTLQVRNTSGTGLGLPIVKRLVELQNGRFAIYSTLGEGTTVEVILPAVTGS